MSTEKRIRRVAVPVASVILAFALGLAIPAGALAACNAPADDGCPLKIGNQVVFDRCFGAPPLGPDAGKKTKVGDDICNILRDTNVLARRLGAGAQTVQNNAQRDLEAFATVTFNESVDQKALGKFNDTNKILKRIEDDVQAFKNDRVCGSKAAMDVLRKSFEDEAQNLRLLGEGIGATANAAAAMAPVASLPAGIAGDMATLGTLANQKGGNAVPAFGQLKATIDSLGKVATELPNLDKSGINAASGAVGMGMLPLVIDSAGCAFSVGTAAASIVSVAASPSMAMVTCLPTAGTGCIVSAMGAGMGVYSAAITLVMASEFCPNAAEKAGGLAKNSEDVRKFFEAVNKLFDDIGKTERNISAADRELTALATEIGANATPAADRIRAKFTQALAPLENGKKILKEQVVPKMERYAGDRFRIIDGKVKQLVNCYNNIEKLSASVNQDVATSATEMGQAAGKILDAGKVLSNIARQGTAAATAGRNFASREWNACDSEEAVLHKDIFGVERGKLDPVKTGAHLAGLATNPNGIASIAVRVARLTTREATVLPKAVEEGKKAFLNLDQSKQEAKRKFDEAEVLAAAAARRIAIAQAKAQAKAHAKEGAAGAKEGAATAGKTTPVTPPLMPALKTEALKASQARVLEPAVVGSPRVVSFRIGGGQEKVNTRSVTLDFVAERASQYRASERQDFSGAQWVVIPGTPPTFPLSAGDGVKTIYLQVKGTMDRVSAVASDTITLQTMMAAAPLAQPKTLTPAATAPPRVTYFQINRGGEVTNDPKVYLHFVAERASQYRASERPDFSGAQWMDIPGAPPMFTLSAGDGVKTVHFQVKSNLGGESASMTDSISLETPPRIVLFTVDKYEGCQECRAGGQNGVRVTLTTEASFPPDKFRISENPDFSGSQWRDWFAPTKNKVGMNITIPRGTGTRSVYLQVMKAGVASKTYTATFQIPPVRIFSSYLLGDMMTFAKTRGWQFNQRAGDPTSACEIPVSGYREEHFDYSRNINLFIPSRALGSRCDFTLFEGRLIKDGWKFKNYVAYADCDPPGRNYTVIERPEVNSRQIRFKVHMWAEPGKKCKWRLTDLTLEGPGDGDLNEPFE